MSDVVKNGGRPVGVLVDAYGTGNYLPPAFGRLGIDVVHVQSSAEPITRMQPWDRASYVDALVYDPHGDTERVLKEMEPLFVIPGQEPGVLLADKLSEALGVRSNGTTFSESRRDKFRMIETVSAAGLRTAAQLVTADAEEALAWVREGGFWPCVAKPLSSASTDGVFVCRDAESLRAAFPAILATDTVFNGANTEVLVQSFLEGTEYIVDTVSVDGHVHVCGVWEYEKSLLDNGKPIYNRDILLSPTDPAVVSLIDYTRDVLAALRIHNGPAHSEVIITPEGPALVEVGARLNGNMHPAFHDACLGANMADLTARAYTRPERFVAEYGDTVYERRQPAVVYNTPTTLSGRITAVNEALVEEIRSRPSVVDITVKRRAGDVIVPTHDLLTSPLRVFLTAPDQSTVDEDYVFVDGVRESVYEVES
ncbi:ATP-grasp domain-containing protein [Actinophytocola oryzae]|uniref:ATP-grasp domain-containing protein n=1 Tax=Actinophytocola oryzae TaxID=502181 RepID=A0A4R7UZI0_9PSEU|nr:ATP-grasp domain-containing protein [Actinophytocola oryzae]TDV40955.1 ATP-grasp domain-containing protein [Actinophytocola oryzae]